MDTAALVPLLYVSTAASILLLYLGLRGRQVDHHPHCRRCGFDLFGKPAESTVCSECGANLNHRRAILQGERVRRKGVLLFGLLLALVAGGLGWLRSNQGELTHYIPQWWLMREVDSSDPAKRDFALVELNRRIKARELTTEREALLRDKALARQADLDQPWVSGWGLIIETLHQVGHLSPDAWDQYLLNAVVFHLTPEEPSIRLCDKLRFQVFRDPDRRSGKPLPGFTGYPVGLYASRHLVISGHAADAVIPYTGSLDWHPEDEVPKLPGLIAAQIYFEPWSAKGPGFPEVEADLAEAYQRRLNDNESDESIQWDPQLAAKLNYGTNTATMTVTIVALWNVPARESAPAQKLKLHAVPLKTTWTYEPTVRLNHDPKYRQAVEAALSPSGIRVVRVPISNLTNWRMEADITCKNPPIDLAFRATIRLKGGGHDTCFPPPMLFFAKGTQAGTIAIASLGEFSEDGRATERYSAAGSADIVLEPDPSSSPIGTREIWGEKVVLKNVPIVRERYSNAFTASNGGTDSGLRLAHEQLEVHGSPAKIRR